MNNTMKMTSILAEIKSSKVHRINLDDSHSDYNQSESKDMFKNI